MGRKGITSGFVRDSRVDEYQRLKALIPRFLRCNGRATSHTSSSRALHLYCIVHSKT
jgi:hypothetical protein